MWIFDCTACQLEFVSPPRTKLTINFCSTSNFQFQSNGALLKLVNEIAPRGECIMSKNIKVNGGIFLEVHTRCKIMQTVQ